MRNIRKDILDLGVLAFNQTSRTIAAHLGVKRPRDKDIKDLEQTLKNMGWVSKWTYRREGRVKVWYDPTTGLGKGKRTLEGKRFKIKKIKLTPIPEHLRRKR